MTIPPQILTYLNNMKPGDTLDINKAKNPELLILSAKNYIDTFGTLQFNANYTTLIKLRPIPQTDQKTFILFF